MDSVSPQVQNQIAQFQQLQQQLQAVLTQKLQMDAQVREMTRTVEELGKAPQDAVIYKNAGSLMIKADGKESVLKDLEESKETLEIRLKGVERQEKALREKYQTMQEQINRAISTGLPLDSQFLKIWKKAKRLLKFA